MSFVDLNLDDIPERQTLAEGEYMLECIGAEVKDSKATVGNRYIELRFKVEEHPEASLVFDRVHLPNESDDLDKKITKAGRLRNAFRDFGIDGSHGFAVEEFVGKRVYAILKVTPADGEYPEKNEIARYVKGA